MAATAIGRYFNIDDLDIKDAVETYRPTNNRSQLTITEHNHIIMDAYNANPTSMLHAIDNFSEMKVKNRVMILGDMLELGDESKKEHDLIVDRLDREQYKVILIGDEFIKSNRGKFEAFKTTKELIIHLQNNSITESTILIKGSRGVKLEECLSYL